jgi:hypothetical protein
VSGRTILGLLFALLLIAGAAAVGVGIYNAGIAQGIAQSADGATPPVVVPAYGYGWGGPGWGIGGLFFGILFFVFFLFLIGGLFRALTYRGRGWGGPGWGGPGRWGAGHDHSVEGFRGSPWEQRAREVHDEWHRQRDASGGSAGLPTPGSTGPTTS